MNRLQLFARTLSLGLATVALPAFVAAKMPDPPFPRGWKSHPARGEHPCDSCDKVAPGDYTCGGEWFCETCMDDDLRGYTNARAAIKDGIAYGWEGESPEYEAGWKLAVDHDRQERNL